MALLEFEAMLADGVIHIPDDITARLADGSVVRVSIQPLDAQEYQLTQAEAWKTFLQFIEERMAKPTLSASYQWQRGDAYEHLGMGDDAKGNH